MENLTNQIQFEKKKFFWLKSQLILNYFSFNYSNFDRDYIKYGYYQLKESLILKESNNLFRIYIWFCCRMEDWNESISTSLKLFNISHINEQQMRLLFLISKFKLNKVTQNDEILSELEELNFDKDSENYFDFSFFSAKLKNDSNSIELYKYCLHQVDSENEYNSLFVYLMGKVIIFNYSLKH